MQNLSEGITLKKKHDLFNLNTTNHLISTYTSVLMMATLTVACLSKNIKQNIS